MLSRSDSQKLAEIRLADSIVLFRSQKYSSAYYLAGYAVELALKARISTLFLKDVIPDRGLVQVIYTHDLQKLLSTSGLEPQLESDMKGDAVLGSYWGIASKWNEGSRYEFWDQIAAATMITAIADENHGVFQWVKKHW